MEIELRDCLKVLGIIRSNDKSTSNDKFKKINKRFLPQLYNFITEIVSDYTLDELVIKKCIIASLEIVNELSNNEICSSSDIESLIKIYLNIFLNMNKSNEFITQLKLSAINTSNVLKKYKLKKINFGSGGPGMPTGPRAINDANVDLLKKFRTISDVNSFFKK